MSTKYPGGFITKSPVAPTSTAASGVWTLDQQQQAQKAGTWPSPPNYIEEVFSTWLYTGTSASQTITNGIDLAGSGGLTWFKNRNNTQSHYLIDSARGISKVLSSNATFGQGTDATIVTSYNSNGFTVEGADVNASTYTYASWTFREQPKFFDIVTWTGDGVANRQISHNLGSVPGCVIVKKTNGTTPWPVYHRSLANQGDFLSLNASTAVDQRFSSFWGTTPFSSTTFSVSDFDELNGSGGTYVAYVFAHNAGGFGLSGTDNVISCGSLTTDANGQATVDLGYEPQWLLIKNTAVETTGPSVSWNMTDNMRGMPVGGIDPRLFANTSGAENTEYDWVSPTATGFVLTPNPAQGGTFANSNYIYIAIRRGPMKVPTDATKVFSPAVFANPEGTKNTVGFPVDLQLSRLTAFNIATYATDRLRGVSTTTTSSGVNLLTSSTAAETTSGNTTRGWDNTGFQTSAFWDSNNIIYWNFQRAPGFFDEVCYTGTGSERTVAHNLTVVPEMMIVKVRSSSNNWAVYHKDLGNTKYLNLDSTAAADTFPLWNDTTPTASVFSLGTNSTVNSFAGSTYVWYGFATCPGVSKVGSFTGTGATQVIDCGFTGGARFVLIKSTSTTGDWYVWDSARGIVAGNDPYLALNSTAAEVTNTDWVDTAASGFELSNAGGNLANSSGVSYIFLAIA